MPDLLSAEEEAKTRASATCTRLGWESNGYDEAEAGRYRTKVPSTAPGHHA